MTTSQPASGKNSAALIRITTASVVVVSLFVAPTQASDANYLTIDDLVKFSIPFEQQYTLSDGARLRVRYRLFLAMPYDGKQIYPLILWLHGRGDYGDDNISQLKHLNVTLYHGTAAQAYPFFVLAPECPNTPPCIWTTPLAGGSAAAMKLQDMLVVAIDILNRIERDYPIDKRRVTVVGISTGGNACWELLQREPRRFAAIVPLAADAAPQTLFAKRLATPVWTFHAANDRGVPIEGIKMTVAALQARGGAAHLTSTNDNRHDCWTKAFQEHDLLHWILAQRRDDPNVPPPGHYRTTVRLALYWSEFRLHVFLAAMLVGIAVICIRHLKKHASLGNFDGEKTSGFNLIEKSTICTDVPQQIDLSPGMNVPDFVHIPEDLP